MDVLKAALVLQSDHYLKLKNPDRGEAWNINNDTYLFQILVNIHQQAHSHIQDKSADEVLDVVLKDLERHKLGVPPGKSQRFIR